MNLLYSQLDLDLDFDFDLLVLLVLDRVFLLVLLLVLDLDLVLLWLPNQETFRHKWTRHPCHCPVNQTGEGVEHTTGCFLRSFYPSCFFFLFWFRTMVKSPPWHMKPGIILWNPQFLK